MTSKVNLEKVESIPKSIDEGILYVSERFKVAAHLCPCGCLTKIITPLGPHEWSLSVKAGKPSLYPSVGNWQLPCRTHYWIRDGKIEWSYSWTDKEIKHGRAREQKKLKEYYSSKNRGVKKPFWRRFLKWIEQKWFYYTSA
ncbi:MAG: hypothetical protein J0L80_01730 [Chitinophagales bacterium]|nr:hypothetical protein [Chitinophagales bacterium]